MAMLPAEIPAQGPVHIRPRRPGISYRGLAGRSDERLVSIAKDGDERAFGALYERHSPAILRYCRSLLRSTQEAEDVKQEVFVLAISALRRGAEPDAFRPWLYRVAHNACMSHLRIRRPVLVADNGVLVGPATAAPVDDHREELRQLLDDIGKLPDVQRGALLLREMDGFSYEQVGEVLGLPLSTVRASIFRARRTLQGLAEARDADCDEIQSELCRLADRRGRRGRHITTHLHVCSNCRDFRDGLRRRPTVLSGVSPVAPMASSGLVIALKGKLLGVVGGGAGAALAGGGGGAGVAKIAAVAASSIALLAGAGIEADRAIENSRPDAGAGVRHAAAAPAGTAARHRGAGSTPAAAAFAPALIAGQAETPLRDGRRDTGAAGAATREPSGARARARGERTAGATAAPRTHITGASGAAHTPATAPGSAAAAGDDDRSGAGRTEGDGGDRHQHSHGARRGDGRSHGTGGGGSSSKGSGSGRSEDSGAPQAPRPGSDDASDGHPRTPSAAQDTPHTNGPGPPTTSTPAPPPPAPAGGQPAPQNGTGTPPTPASPTPDPAPAPAPAPADPPVPPADPPAPGDPTGTVVVTPADTGGATAAAPLP